MQHGQDENAKYHTYLYKLDPTLTRDGCCQAYPLDRDYWNNQILDRTFLINYPLVDHIKYPISEGQCTGDWSVGAAKGFQYHNFFCSRPLDARNNRIWTIEAEGLVDGVSCQKSRVENQMGYWRKHDARGSCPSEGLPVLNTNIGQNLADPCTGALDMNALASLEEKRLKNQCCPNLASENRQWDSTIISRYIFCW